jgi:short-subunit dehydrogenase
LRKLDFHGSFVLVTGASSGIGVEFARKLAHQGANLVLTARSADKLQRLAEDLTLVNGVTTHCVVADLGTVDGIRELLERVDALPVTIDHVVNNAGFGSSGAFAEADPENEARMLRVNCEAVLSITRHFLPRFLKQRSGGLIQVASTAANQPMPFMATYAASKSFVLNFSLALSQEIRNSGVRLTVVCPGPVPTGFQETAGIPNSKLLEIVKLDAASVVESALSAYASGKTLIVPGTMNSVQSAATRVLPRALLLRATRWAMHGLGRARA